MATAAFFISPSGDILPVTASHIAMIIENPERFGLSFAEIEAAYKACGEKLGLEGQARREIICGLILQGWIRIRHYPKDAERGWRFNVRSLTPEARAVVSNFARSLTSQTGINRIRGADPYARVSINSADGEELRMTIDELEKMGSQL